MGSAADVALLPSLHQSAAAGILEIKILYISYGPPTIDGALGHAQGVFIAPNPDPTRKAARPDQGPGLVSRIPTRLLFVCFLLILFLSIWRTRIC